MAVALTLLKITGLEVAPYATRGATQTLRPIAQAAAMLRTVNGELDDLSLAQFRKFASTISCEDVKAPAFNGLWQGQEITVECISELSYKTVGGTPDRPVVTGSSYTLGDLTYYRPVIIFRVIDFNADTDEWGGKVNWTMQLEEK